jgi:endogenous inhibitor of DNA gyrase (YacG/DUF329 family)
MATMACPICARPQEPRYRPFCSRRCADVDLARWLKGTYAIPVDPADDGADSPEGSGDPGPGKARD